ncbi:MAG: glycosyltransferase [Pseudomonadota bacterium]
MWKVTPAIKIKSKVKIAAVICTYNRYDLLDKAIQSAIKQSLPKDEYTIYVIDNSPDYAFAEKFGQKYAGVENLVYVVERTPGLSNARNVAAAATSADVVAYLDDDAVAYPTWLHHLLEAYEMFGDSAGVVGGRILPIWDVPRPSWLHDDNLGYVTVVDYGGSTRICEPHEWVAGANISYKRDLLLEVGGFDTNLGRKGPESSLLSNEETQVSDAIHARGAQTIYAPSAVVDHLVDKRRLDQEWFRKRAAWQAVSDYLKNPNVVEWSHLAYDATLEFLMKQPARHRNISGLRSEQTEAEGFRDQLGAIYNMTIASLCGFKKDA